jgi:intein/homing endonuclease
MTDPFAESKVYFGTQLQEFQYFDKYSRYDREKGRRETWTETVKRAANFLRELSHNRLSKRDYEDIEQAMLHMEVMPSMRLLATAGEAARRDKISIFNCAYRAIDGLSAFTDILRLSMNGVGVGFSVENRYVQKLPTIKKQEGECTLHTVEDSTDGWVNALQFGLRQWVNGYDVVFDFSHVRKAGEELKTKGGFSSGPDPLRQLLEFSRSLILSRQRKQLRSIDVYDLVCMIESCVISGGVRRCLPGWTKIHTRRGAIPITDVKIGDEVMTDVGYKKVVDFVEQGNQQLVQINTESGTKFICTPDHRVAVLKDIFGNYEFKEAQYLSKSDKLLFITNAIEGANLDLIQLPEFREADKVRTNIAQPKLTSETAWFLGKFLADGYVSSERGEKRKISASISFNSKEEDQINRVSEWLASHGVPFFVQEHNGNWVSIRINQRRFCRWLRNYKHANETIYIPDEIWKASLDVRVAFIAGVFDGDGCASDRPVTIVSTIYEDFARDMVKLLSTLGILSEIKETSDRESRIKKGWKPQFRVSIKEASALKKAQSMIWKFSIKRWKERRINSKGYSFPLSMAKRGLKEIGDAYYKYNTTNSSTIANATGKHNFVPIGVVSVEPYGYDQTYDISVEGEHVFVAEGYLVHNTAALCLFDYNDESMLDAKTYENTREKPFRYYSNNSAVLPERHLSQAEIMQFVMKMHQDGNGEPGIFSRLAVKNTIPERRELRDFGVNACAESVLRNKGLCNLSSVVCRADDTVESLKHKVKVATMIGTIQAMATDYNGFDEEWIENARDERLLGVDLNAQMDCEVVRDPDVQKLLKNLVILWNGTYAKQLGINKSKATTLVKPSGNSGVLLNVSSGLHPRWSEYYIRNVRVNADSPLCYAMRESGVSMSPENGQTEDDATSYVVSFPIKSPEGAVTRKDLTAIDQCEYWKQVKMNWCEHNPSITVYYGDDEILDVARWIYDNQSIISGMAFLPKDDAVYEQAPYIEITKAQYEEMAASFPTIDFSLIAVEERDTTTGAQEVACSAGVCDLHL